jgi:hypothetical protein
LRISILYQFPRIIVHYFYINTKPQRHKDHEEKRLISLSI